MLEWEDKPKTKEQRKHCLNYGFLVNLHVRTTELKAFGWLLLYVADVKLLA